MNENKRPSVKQISEITGFSPATVSNALNGKHGVSMATMERVLQVAEELGYSRSKNLQYIKFVTFRRTGEILDDSVFHHAVIEGVEAAAHASNLATMYVRLDRNSPRYDEDVASIVNDTNCGIILLATEMQEEDFDPFLKCQVPILLLDGWCYRQTFNGVLINNIDPIVSEVAYLYKHGHKKIGYIRGSCRIRAFRDREIGYQQGLKLMGLTYDPNYVVTVGTKVESAYPEFRNWLDTKPELPTAFIADNDLIALGAMRALKDAGYLIPGDVSIVGFDDLSVCAVSGPALSTVRVHKQSMGWEAVRRLLLMIENPGGSCFKVESCTDFIERDSVKQI